MCCADFEEVSGKRETATLHRRLRTSERSANTLRDYFGTFRAVSGLLALFRSLAPVSPPIEHVFQLSWRTCAGSLIGELAISLAHDPRLLCWAFGERQRGRLP